MNRGGSNVWSNSTCYHPPRAYPREFAIFLLFFYWVVYSPTRARRKRQFPAPGALHWSHGNKVLILSYTLHSHTKEKQPRFLCQDNIKIAIFISEQNHTINITITHAVDSTSTPNLCLTMTLAFLALYGACRYSY